MTCLGKVCLTYHRDQVSLATPASVEICNDHGMRRIRAPKFMFHADQTCVADGVLWQADDWPVAAAWDIEHEITLKEGHTLVIAPQDEAKCMLQ